MNSETPDDRYADMVWQGFLDDEFRVRERILRGDTDGDVVREWWRAIATAAKEYGRRVALGERPEPPPADLLAIVAGLADFLAVGKCPEPIRDAIKEGRTEAGPDETSDLGLALAYLVACTQEGFQHFGATIRIEDRHPVKTIAGWFGVTRQTVHDWKKRHTPAIPGIRRIDPETFRETVIAAGARFSSAGRSHKAIASRSRQEGPLEV